ncbi:MAG: histidine phosphatase family protein [Alphaproteobacteria bacterium]
MKLILARHGNTFNAGEPVVMAGLTNDVPLVTKGMEQADAVGKALKHAGITPAAVYCSTLQRTRQFAEIVCATLGLPLEPQPDARLDELDYGAWTGLTDAEIDAMPFGAEARENWQKKSIWPSHAQWNPTPEKVIADVKSFAADMTQRHGDAAAVLAVTSNGRLRYFLHLYPGAWEKHHAAGNVKVGTGHLCVLDESDDNWEIEAWNVAPHALQVESQ